MSFYTIASAQTYKNVRAKQDGLSITVQYDMAGKLFRGDQVALTYSLDNGKTFSVITNADGDLGANVLPGKNNEINWLLIDKDFIIGKIINFRVVTIPEGMVYVDGGKYTRTSIDDKKKDVTTISAFSSILTKPTDNSTLDFTIRLDNHSKFGNKTTGRVAATYNLSQNLIFKIGGGTGFRAPSLYELHTQWGGNVNLKPENSSNIDAGLNYMPENSGLELQASIFKTEVKDEIIYSYSDGYSQSENSTKRQGLSIGVDYKISDASKLNLKYATTTDEKGNNVSRIPKNSISFNGQTILSVSYTHLTLPTNREV